MKKIENSRVIMSEIGSKKERKRTERERVIETEMKSEVGK